MTYLSDPRLDPADGFNASGVPAVFADQSGIREITVQKTD